MVDPHGRTALRVLHNMPKREKNRTCRSLDKLGECGFESRKLCRSFWEIQEPFIQKSFSVVRGMLPGLGDSRVRLGAHSQHARRSFWEIQEPFFQKRFLAAGGSLPLTVHFPKAPPRSVRFPWHRRRSGRLRWRRHSRRSKQRRPPLPCTRAPSRGEREWSPPWRAPWWS